MATLRQMEYLVTVVDQQSFTRAAERLHVTQSGLSQQIKALERDVGATLLERLPDGLRLTAAGEAFTREAETALRSARRAQESVTEVVEGITGRLEIATVFSLAVGLLPTSLGDWTRDWPGVAVTLREFSHRRLLESWVLRGMADLGIGPVPPSWTGDAVDIGTERFVIVAPPEDESRVYVRSYDDAPPRAAPRSQGRLALHRLRDRSWVMMARDNGLSDLTEAHLTGVGLRDPAVVVRTMQTEAAARLAAAGLGLAIVPANVVPPDLPALIVEPDPPLTRPLAAYARGRFSASASRFVATLLSKDRTLERDSTAQRPGTGDGIAPR